jgi:hypothetical protein
MKTSREPIGIHPDPKSRGRSLKTQEQNRGSRRPSGGDGALGLPHGPLTVPWAGELVERLSFYKPINKCCRPTSLLCTKSVAGDRFCAEERSRPAAFVYGFIKRQSFDQFTCPGDRQRTVGEPQRTIPAGWSAGTPILFLGFQGSSTGFGIWMYSNRFPGGFHGSPGVL